MLILLVILLTVLLIASVVGNVIFWKAAVRQMVINDIYEQWIADWRLQVFKTWHHMRILDDRQMFEKDDEVGVVFQDMMELIKSLNDRTEETTEEITHQEIKGE
jgi:hypothetical protein